MANRRYGSVEEQMVSLLRKRGDMSVSKMVQMLRRNASASEMRETVRESRLVELYPYAWHNGRRREVRTMVRIAPEFDFLG